MNCSVCYLVLYLLSDEFRTFPSPKFLVRVCFSVHSKFRGIKAPISSVARSWKPPIITKLPWRSGGVALVSCSDSCPSSDLMAGCNGCCVVLIIGSMLSVGGQDVCCGCILSLFSLLVQYVLITCK